MSGLTIGLAGVAAAFVTRALGQVRLGDILWLVAACAALVVFVGDPRPFAEMTIWAAASAIIWFADTSRAKPAIICSGVAGFLVGAGAPYLALALGDNLAGLPDLSGVLVAVLAVLAGLVLAGGSGGAVVLLAAGLPLGLFALPVSATALVAGVVMAQVLSARQGFWAAAVLLLLPFIGFLGGME